MALGIFFASCDELQWNQLLKYIKIEKISMRYIFELNRSEMVVSCVYENRIKSIGNKTELEKEEICIVIIENNSGLSASNINIEYPLPKYELQYDYMKYMNNNDLNCNLKIIEYNLLHPLIRLFNKYKHISLIGYQINTHSLLFSKCKLLKHLFFSLLILISFDDSLGNALLLTQIEKQLKSLNISESIAFQMKQYYILY